MPVNPNDEIMNPFRSIKHDFTRYVQVKNCDFEISTSVAKRILESLPGVESVRFMLDEELGVWYRAYVIFEDKLSAENAVKCLNLRVLGKQMFSADNVHDRLLHTWQMESTTFAYSYEYAFYGAVVVDNLHNSEINLYDMFSKYGSIIFIYVIQCPGDGTRLRTLVVYSTLVEAVGAVIAMHNTKILGRTVYARLLLTAKDYNILSLSEQSDMPINENYSNSDMDIETMVHNECHDLTYRSNYYSLETELNESDYENDKIVEKVLKINEWSKEMETDIESKAESEGLEINASECKEYETTTESNLVLNSFLDVEPIGTHRALEAIDCFCNEDAVMKSDYDIKERNDVCGEDNVKDEKIEVAEVAVIVKESCSSVDNIEKNNNPTSHSRLKRNSYISGWNNRRNNAREKQDCKSSSVSNGNYENPKKRRQSLENTHPKREAVVKQQQNPQGWKQVRRNSSQNRWNRKRNNSADQFFEYRNDTQNHFGRGNYLQKLRSEAVRGNWNQQNVFYNGDRKKSGMGKLRQPLNEERRKDCSLIPVSAPDVKFMVTGFQSESNNVAYHDTIVNSVENSSTVVYSVANQGTFAKSVSNRSTVTNSVANHCTVTNSIVNHRTDDNSIVNQISNADVKISVTCCAENTPGILNTTPTRGTYAEALARTGVGYTNSTTRSLVAVES